MLIRSPALPLLFTLVSVFVVSAVSEEVTYDGRSFIINGKRELFFSGSVHYPRVPVGMWPEIFNKSKHGGLNTIETYVFWNVHEPKQGKYNFEGNYDLVKFIKLIKEMDMYAVLRIGPFVQAEWNYGGLPYWLREVPNITFRTDNEPYKIENEYNTIQLAYREAGISYVHWAAKMAVGLNTGVPWVMCKQKEAPDPVINSCNGRNCGDTFIGPNKPNKPFIWTENWTAQYRVFGDPPSQRAAEDLAFAVARFFSKKGTLNNYYMYHGGTNYGRTSADFVTTRYYDEAPLDEYGLQKDPKWGHLRDLHAALRLCKKALLWGTPSVQKLENGVEARIFENSESKVCAAFLCNNNTREPATAKFRGKEYYFPPRSISILPDCKTVVFNTQNVVSQHNSRSYKISKRANKNLEWEMYHEKIPIIDESPVKYKNPLELMNQTKDRSDYLWYTTKIQLTRDDLPFRRDIHPVLQVSNFGHVMHTFANGEYVGSGHGSHIEKSFTFQKPVPLKPGTNHIQLLGMTVGFPDSGAYLNIRLAGVHRVAVQGLNTGTLDLSANGWGHQVGVDGEKNEIFTPEGTEKVSWKEAKGGGHALTWYKTYFDAPEGDNPVALNLTSMGKGMVWVNGKSIGRYWVDYKSPLGKPTQSEYHVPRVFLKPSGNLLVVLEEMGGNPEEIKILTVNRDTICSIITEHHSANVQSWQRENGKIRAVVGDTNPKAHLKCPNHKVIVNVDFATFGNVPTGACGAFTPGNCTSSSEAKKVVEQYCLGKTTCDIPVDQKTFGGGKGDECPGIKSLAVQVHCAGKDD
uniref:beta-galactosidase n=1 Tax=Nelumbo nucifera TaxID=4432 RepID=A0A822ZIX7_NELNU|nr:TPA_asm: hypothetical protein HUJ06_015981 [Nelumbo nucifera]